MVLDRIENMRRLDGANINMSLVFASGEVWPYTYDPNETNDINAEVTSWLLANPDAEIAETTAPILSEVIAAKLAALGLYRWEREIGGVAFAGGTIRTDPNSQAKVTAAYMMAKLDPTYTISTWEMVPGTFISLDNAAIIAMGEAVRNHVQDTFDRKAVLHGQIASLDTIEQVQAFDIAAAWSSAVQ